MHIPPLDKPLHPGLYLVPTPIGNLADITIRGLQVLSSVAWIAAEDTRVTRKLLSHYGIQTPMIAYHDHNASRMQARLLQILNQGQSIALVSDAGTPLVSDPGFDIVRACIAEHQSVFPLPGASAVLTALIGSVLPQHAFTFGGFIPARAHARQVFLESFQSVDHTLIFFETSRRLKDTLRACLACFGDRSAVVARELSKFFETFYRSTLQGLIDDPTMDKLKGEIVLLMGGKEKTVLTAEQIDAALRQALSCFSLSDAVKNVHHDLGVARHILYRQALNLREE